MQARVGKLEGTLQVEPFGLSHRVWYTPDDSETGEAIHVLNIEPIQSLESIDSATVIGYVNVGGFKNWCRLGYTNLFMELAISPETLAREINLKANDTYIYCQYLGEPQLKINQDSVAIIVGTNVPVLFGFSGHSTSPALRLNSCQRPVWLVGTIFDDWEVKFSEVKECVEKLLTVCGVGFKYLDEDSPDEIYDIKTLH